jgi:NAD(P)-dependent dehydrogenase (short-subunit alcohol dehydrogenase family)
MQVHLYGAFWVTLPAWKLMREQGFRPGDQHDVRSRAVRQLRADNYGAAKMGLVGFTRSLAQEGRKHNVLADVIAPGARTRVTEELLGPIADALDPELVSPVVVYLASDPVRRHRADPLGRGRPGQPSRDRRAAGLLLQDPHS